MACDGNTVAQFTLFRSLCLVIICILSVLEVNVDYSFLNILLRSLLRGKSLTDDEKEVIKDSAKCTPLCGIAGITRRHIDVLKTFLKNPAPRNYILRME